MTTRKRYTLADVRASYSREKALAERAGELPAYLVYRPLSFPLAWLCLRLGVPTLSVTLCCGGIALALPLAAAYAGERAYLLVAGLALSFHVLDCVDGNMARTTHGASRFGALLDGLCDYAFWCALLASIGLLAAAQSGSSVAGFGTQLGLACAVLVLLARDVRQHFAIRFHEPALFEGSTLDAPPTPGQWAFFALAGLENLYAPLLALCGALALLPELLLGIALYVVCVAIASVTITLRKARRLEQAANAQRSVDGAQQ